MPLRLDLLSIWPSCCIPTLGWPLPGFAVPVVCLLLGAGSPLHAASIAPPMLDITRQCGTTHRSAAAMSECVVAESEARAELLRNWTRYTDAGAERCLAEAPTRKGRRQVQTYDAIAKCLSVETAALPPLPPAGTAPAEGKGFGSMFKSFFKSDNTEK